MQRTKKFCSVVAMTFATWSVANIAAAQEPQPEPQQQPPTQETPRTPPAPETPKKQEPSQTQTSTPTEISAEKMSATATVDKIDAKKRKLTLKDEAGHKFKVAVPKSAGDISKVKKGDTVAVEYFASLALELRKGDMKEPSAQGETVSKRTAAPLPGGVIAHKMSVTAEVMNVDTTANTVTIKTPAGAIETISVTDPALREDLAKLTKGDKIHAVYNEAVAIAVTPHKHPQQGQKPKQQTNKKG